jgi:hypothetical protein
MILQYLIVTFILLIWITLNEIDQRFHIYMKYSSCNNSAFCEIFSQKFLRVFHFDDDDGRDEIHTEKICFDSKRDLQKSYKWSLKIW